MISNKVFTSYTHYPNKLDKLFVWMVDCMELSMWYDSGDKWDDVLKIYDANCYNSGMIISLDNKNRFKKISEETMSKREFELLKKRKHEEFINSIDID